MLGVDGLKYQYFNVNGVFAKSLELFTATARREARFFPLDACKMPWGLELVPPSGWRRQEFDDLCGTNCSPYHWLKKTEHLPRLARTTCAACCTHNTTTAVSKEAREV